jgi:hypothetical protein
MSAMARIRFTSCRRTTGLLCLTAFCVQQHNTVMPYRAFDGQTPDEMYLGRGHRIDELSA